MTRRIFPFLVVTLLAGALSSPAQQKSSKANDQPPVYVVSHIDVMPDYSAATNKLLQQYEADSRKDKGSVRFEVMVQDGRPNHFTIVEVWRNRAAFEAHTALPHTRDFREKLQPYLGSPYDERLHAVI